MTFTNPPLEDMGQDEKGVQLFRLVEPLVFVTPMNGKGSITVTVPEGFVTDFASVPRFFWRIVPPFGPWNKAAIVHDYLYSVSGKCSRFFADAIFREAMAELGVPRWKRLAMYYAVRFFGSRNFRKYTNGL